MNSQANGPCKRLSGCNPFYYYYTVYCTLYTAALPAVLHDDFVMRRPLSLLLSLSILAAMLMCVRGFVNSEKNQRAAAQLQTRVDEAIAKGSHEVFVLAGDYYFGNNTFLVQSGMHLTIRCAPGTATLWFWGWKGAVQLQQCTNVTVRGFILDRNPTPYIAGTDPADMSSINQTQPCYSAQATSQASPPMEATLSEQQRTLLLLCPSTGILERATGQ